MKRCQAYFYSVVVLIMLSGLPAPAEPTAAAAVPQVSTAKKHVINFEDELIEGHADKPDLFYLLQKKNFNYKRLIRLRENFLPEMRRSSEDIKRLRGGR